MGTAMSANAGTRLVLGHEHVLGDVDLQLLLLEHLDQVLGLHLIQRLLRERRQRGLHGGRVML